MRVGGLDRQRPAIRHGVAGIDREVEDRALQLVRIARGQPEAAGRHEFEADVLGDGPAEQFLHGRHELVGIDGLGVEGLPAREGEQAVGESRRPVRGGHGGRRVALQVLGPTLRDARLHEIEGSHDSREQVVEVVGDAARELADRLHLLSLAQLILQELALRDVTADPIDDVRLRGQGPVDPSIRPVPGPQAQVEIGDTPSGPKGRERVLQRRAVLGMNQGIEPDPDGFLRRIAQKAAPGRIGFAQDPVPIAGGEEVPGQAPDPIPFPRALLDALLEGFVEGSEVLLGAFRLGDVVDDARRSAGRPSRRPGHVRPAAPANGSRRRRRGRSASRGTRRAPLRRPRHATGHERAVARADQRIDRPEPAARSRGEGRGARRTAWTP